MQTVRIPATSIWHEAHSPLVDRLMDLALDTDTNADNVVWEPRMPSFDADEEAAPPPSSDRRILTTILQFLIAQFDVGDSPTLESPAKAAVPRRQKPHPISKKLSPQKVRCSAPSYTQTQISNSSRLHAANTYLSAVNYSAYLDSVANEDPTFAVMRAREIRLLSLISLSALCKQMDSEKLQAFLRVKATMQATDWKESAIVIEALVECVLSLIDVHDGNRLHSRPDDVMFHIAWRTRMIWEDVLAWIDRGAEKIGLCGSILCELVLKIFLKGLGRFKTSSTIQCKILVAMYMDIASLLSRTLSSLPLVLSPSVSKLKNVRIMAHPLSLLKQIVNPVIKLVIWDPGLQEFGCKAFDALSESIQCKLAGIQKEHRRIQHAKTQTKTSTIAPLFAVSDAISAVLHCCKFLTILYVTTLDFTKSENSVHFITKWLILSASGNIDSSKSYESTEGLRNGFLKKFPQFQAMLNFRLFSIQMLGILTNESHEISMCLFSLFSDPSEHVRKASAKALAIRSLNNSAVSRSSSCTASTINAVHHREDGSCVFTDPFDAMGIAQWFRQYGEEGSTNMSRRSKKWVELPLALKAPYKHLLACLDQCVDWNEVEGCWRGTSDERSTFGFWAYYITEHLFLICPVLANSLIYDQDEARMYLPYQSHPRQKVITKVVTELEARTGSERQLSRISADKSRVARQLVAYVALGILEGSKIQGKYPLCEPRVLRSLAPLLYTLRRDGTVLIRCLVLESLARTLNVADIVNRVNESAGVANPTDIVGELLTPTLPGKPSSDDLESLRLIYRLVRGIQPFRIYDDDLDFISDDEFDHIEKHGKIETLRTALMNYGEIVHLRALYNFDASKFNGASLGSSLGKDYAKIPQGLPLFEWETMKKSSYARKSDSSGFPKDFHIEEKEVSQQGTAGLWHIPTSMTDDRSKNDVHKANGKVNQMSDVGLSMKLDDRKAETTRNPKGGVRFDIEKEEEEVFEEFKQNLTLDSQKIFSNHFQPYQPSVVGQTRFYSSNLVPENSKRVVDDFQAEGASIVFKPAERYFEDALAQEKISTSNTQPFRSMLKTDLTKDFLIEIDDDNSKFSRVVEIDQRSKNRVDIPEALLSEKETDCIYIRPRTPGSPDRLNEEYGLKGAESIPTAHNNEIREIRSPRIVISRSASNEVVDTIYASPPGVENGGSSFWLLCIHLKCVVTQKSCELPNCSAGNQKTSCELIPRQKECAESRNSLSFDGSFAKELQSPLKTESASRSAPKLQSDSNNRNNVNTTMDLQSLGVMPLSSFRKSVSTGTVNAKAGNLSPATLALTAQEKSSKKAVSLNSDSSLPQSSVARDSAIQKTWLLRRQDYATSPSQTPAALNSPSMRVNARGQVQVNFGLSNKTQPFANSSESKLDFDELETRKYNDDTRVSQQIDLDAFLAGNCLRFSGNRIAEPNVEDISEHDYSVLPEFDLEVDHSQNQLASGTPKNSGDRLLAKQLPSETNNNATFEEDISFERIVKEPSSIAKTPGSPISFSWTNSLEQPSVVHRKNDQTMENCLYEDEDEQFGGKDEAKFQQPSAVLSFFKNIHSSSNLSGNVSNSIVRPRTQAALELVLRHLVFCKDMKRGDKSDLIDYYELFSDGLAYGSLQNLAAFPAAENTAAQQSWTDDSEDEPPLNEPLHPALKRVFQLDMSLMVDMCCSMRLGKTASESVTETGLSAPKRLRKWIAGLAELHRFLLPASRAVLHLEAQLSSQLSLAQAMVVVRDQISLLRMTKGIVGCDGSVTFLEWAAALTSRMLLTAVSSAKPRYDQSTYWGRLRHFSEITDPRNLFATDSQLQRAKNLLADYKAYFLRSRNAKLTLIVVDSTFHSDTGEKILLPFRMACFVPTNALIVAGMLMPNPSIASIVFWQWANQSVNVAFNYCNANKTTEMNMSETVCKEFISTAEVA
ncbi:hypothetical protein HDU83_008038 [Entophlyctis luteolus]|nr:hypothetical protein HDU83_008038 [Entophlyctis luteolus]